MIEMTIRVTADNPSDVQSQILNLFNGGAPATVTVPGIAHTPGADPSPDREPAPADAPPPSTAAGNDEKPADEKPKKRRGRPAKKKAAEPAEPTPPANDDDDDDDLFGDDEDDEDGDDGDGEPLTYDSVLAAFTEYNGKHGLPACKEILQGFGVARFRELPPEKYPDLMKKLKG